VSRDDVGVVREVLEGGIKAVSGVEVSIDAQLEG
jgi:hypothetical protein